MQGIIYTRVSSDEQVKGTSLENQEQLCQAYCAQRGIQIVAIFKEGGESAKDLSLNNRKQFLSALEFCRKRKDEIQAFIVLRVDRFARNTEDHFAVRKILLEYGTSLHSVTEPIGNKPAEKFIETVLAGAAEYDNAIRKQRCSDGMSQKINQGIYPWKPPVGYACQHAKKHGEKKATADPPDEQTFPLIQRALQEYASSRCNMAEMSRLLDKWGLAQIRCKPTSGQFVDRLVHRSLKFYAGILFNPWTGKDITGLHKPMITKEEYYKILLINAGKSPHQVPRTTYNENFPLRRVVSCAKCKRPLTGSFSKGRSAKYPYYHCFNKECELCYKVIEKTKIEPEFMAHLKEIAPKAKWITAFNRVVLERWKEQGLGFQADVQRRENHLKQLKEREKRIYEMREDGTYAKDVFLERKQEIENQLAAAKIALSESKIDMFDLEATIIYATKFISDLGRQWFDLKPEQRPRFQKLIFPVGISYSKKEGFGTAQLGLIYEIITDSRGRESALVVLF